MHRRFGYASYVMVSAVPKCYDYATSISTFGCGEALWRLGQLVVSEYSSHYTHYAFDGYLSSLWHTVAFNRFMTTAITLSSLVLRTAIVLQAALMTSTLASLALERAQIRCMDLASVSIARSNNGGLTCSPGISQEHISKSMEDERVACSYV